MIFEKPVTDRKKKRANSLYSYMRPRGTIALEEACRICGVKTKRQARDIIALLASKVPIISTYDRRGYRLAIKVKDYKGVLHALAELDSRIEELKKRRAPLTAFKEKAELIMQNGSV